MKKLEIYMKPEKIEKLKELVVKHRCGGMSISNIMGFGNSKGKYTEEEQDLFTNLIPKLQVVIVIEDSKLDEMLFDIHNELGTGTIGDGKVFVTNVEEAMRIRTGQRGEASL